MSETQSLSLAEIEELAFGHLRRAVFFMLFCLFLAQTMAVIRSIQFVRAATNNDNDMPVR